MVEQHVPTAKGLAPPRRMYQGAYREELEQDDATPQEPAANQSDPAATPTDQNPEERNYKQRYDALKAHYDRTIVDARKREVELKSQLSAATQSSTAMPKSPEELLAWKNQYPDLYGVLVTAIRTEMKGTEDTINERLNLAELATKSARREKAEAALERLHPDFPQLRMSEEFHTWVKEQPEQIQSWLYDNEDDPFLAARAIDLYKNDKGLKAAPVKPKTDLKAAANAVSTTSRVADPDPAGKKQWKASDVAKLNRRDYTDALEQEIDLARREGRFINDL